MRTKYFHRRPHQPGLYFPAAAGLLLLTAALAPAGAAEATPPAAKTDAAPIAVASTAQIEEIVVTARKRKEKSQEVPIALTALSGDRLTEQGINNIRDFYKQVPSMSVSIPNARNTSLNIRGLGSAIANDALEASVGVFVDGVYYARPGASTFDILDLDRVEVLRGPQGTLFGKNTTAGALNISTKKPSFDPESTVEVSAGNYGYGQVKLSTTGPINDVLAYRVSLSGTKRDGFIHNVRNGQDIDDYNDQSFRGQLLYKPNNDFDFRLILDSDKQKLHCCVGLLKDTNIPTQVAGYSYQARAANAGYVSTTAGDPFNYQTDINNPLLVKTAQQGISGEANWNVFDGYTLTSITAARKWTFNPQNDWDYTGLDVLRVNSTYSTQKQFSQELRLASPTDQKLEYVLGLYYFWQYIKSDNVNTYGADAYNFLSPGTTFGGYGALGTAAMNGLTDVQHTEPRTNSYSTFGQSTLHVTDDLSLTGGLRYTYEKKHVGFLEYGYGGTGLAASAFRASLAPNRSFDLDYSEGNLSGLASLSYKITDTILGYASYNRGYKSGGINVTSVPTGFSQLIDPETADAYELGLKTELFDRKLRFNTALFWEDISNYQANAVYYESSTNKTYSYISNVGKVRTRGVEVDAAAVLFHGLTVTASGAFTDPKYLSYPNAPCPVESYSPSHPTCDVSGYTVAGISRWSGYLGANYTLPIGGYRDKEILGYVDADYSYKSSAQSGLSKYTWLPAYGLVNLRIGARLDDGSTDISVWARNLFDTNYYTAIGTLPSNTGATAGFVGDPRTVGLTLRQTF